MQGFLQQKVEVPRWHLASCSWHCVLLEMGSSSPHSWTGAGSGEDSAEHELFVQHRHKPHTLTEHLQSKDNGLSAVILVSSMAINCRHETRAQGSCMGRFQRCRHRCGNSLVHPVQVSSISKLFAARGPKQLFACCRAVEAISRYLRGHSPRANASLFMQSVKISLQDSGHSDPQGKYQPI